MNKFVLTFISGIALVSTIFGVSALVLNNQQEKKAFAASEPSCAMSQTVTSPTWNPYPITTQYANPQPAQCLDLPLLAFFPLDGTNGLPREKTITKKSDVFTIHAYYNNGAKPGSTNLSNPRIKIYVDKVSATRLKISAELLGDNSTTVSSAQKGGDLFVNIPSGATFNYSGGTTRHYIDAIERREAADTTGAIPFDSIPDYTVTDSSQTKYMNPIYSRYDGYSLTQANGFQMKSGGLEAGFLGYGYILSDISVRSAAPLGNLPPQITGEEITIIRGQSGGFSTPLTPTDPDNNYPVTLDTTSVLPSFCKLSGTPNAQGGGQMIGGCQTDANTPVKTTFVITPTDSLGLVGTPGTWIINVIDPNWNAVKRCFKLNTTTPCSQSALSAGDKIKYEIQVNNTTTNIDATNLKIVDTYDKVKIGQVVNISDSGTVDSAAGVVTWANLGTLRANSSKTVSFEATITQAVTNPDEIINRAKITADNLPELNVDVKFPIAGPKLQAVKTCFRKGTTTPCDQAGLNSGELISYKIKVSNTGTSQATEVKVTDTYDKTKINNVININPNGTLDTTAGTIIWDIGTMQANATVDLTFDATINAGLPAGTQILNTAVVKSKEQPDITVSVLFPLQFLPPITPRTGGEIYIVAIVAIALMGGYTFYYYYKKNNKLGHAFIPGRSKENELTSPIKETEATEHKHRNYHVRGAKKHKD